MNRSNPLLLLFFRAVCAVSLIGVMAVPPAAVASDDSRTAIPQWLQGYDIQPEFVPQKGEDIGIIKSVQGRVVIIHQETDDAFFGSVGDPVFRKDLIATLADSVCRIQFSSMDSANLSPNSILTIEDYLDARTEKKKSAVLTMKAGRIFFYVLRLLGYRDTDFQVQTPSSVAAVRGTKFGLHVYESLDPKTGEKGVFTNCYCADGLIEIDDRWVRKGELYRSVTGEVRPVPPTYLDQFHAALHLPAPALPVPSKSKQDRSADDISTAELDQTGDHTDTVQEQRYLDLVTNRDSAAGDDPVPQPNPAPENPSPEPAEPEQPDPPPSPDPPSVPEIPPAEPGTPPTSEPPSEPGAPPIQEPPVEPSEPSAPEPTPVPQEPSDPEPPSKPEEPPTDPAEPSPNDDLDDSGDDRPEEDPGHHQDGDHDDDADEDDHNRDPDDFQGDQDDDDDDDD